MIAPTRPTEFPRSDGMPGTPASEVYAEARRLWIEEASMTHEDMIDALCAECYLTMDQALTALIRVRYDLAASADAGT